MAEFERNISAEEQEIAQLREQNQRLTTELAYHRRLFAKIRSLVELSDQVLTASNRDHSLQHLLEENERLRNRLQMEKLTNREKEVLRYIANGYTSKEGRSCSIGGSKT